MTHIKTHKQHAGLQPRTRQRDKANSNLFTACLPNGTSYSSQMANPTTEGVIIQLPLTHRSGEEPEQGQDTEQLVTGRAASQPSCPRQQPAADGQAPRAHLPGELHFFQGAVLDAHLSPPDRFVVCLFLYRCPFTAHVRIRPKMFKKNMPSLNFYLFIQNKQPDLLRYKFACVHDLKSIVGSFTE